MRQGSTSLDQARRRAALAFAAPAFAFFVIVMLVPVLAVFVLAFTSWTGLNVETISWVGTANFQRMTDDPVFWATLGRTLLFVVVTTAGLNILGFSLALMLVSGVRGSGFLRLVLLIPLGISPVLAAHVWQQMLGPFGLVNQVLGLVGIRRILFFDAGLAFASVLVVSLWLYMGFNTLLYYAGLQNLPRDRVDAAAVDGAGLLQTIRHVVIPFMRPVIAVVVVLNLIGGWKVFDIVMVLTQGGPDHATEVLSTYLYKKGFELNSVGLASSVAVVIVALATISALTRRPVSGEA